MSIKNVEAFERAVINQAKTVDSQHVISDKKLFVQDAGVFEPKLSLN